MLIILSIPIGILCLVLSILCLRRKRMRQAVVCALAGLLVLGAAALMSYGGSVLIQKIALPNWASGTKGHSFSPFLSWMPKYARTRYRQKREVDLGVQIGGDGL